MSKTEGPKSYYFPPFSSRDTLGVTKTANSTPKSYDDHPRQVKYGSPPLPPPPGTTVSNRCRIPHVYKIIYILIVTGTIIMTTTVTMIKMTVKVAVAMRMRKIILMVLINT